MKQSMEKPALQRYCLREMGITPWQQRTDQRDHVLIIAASEGPAAALNPDKKQLCEKMAQALRWPIEKTILVQLENLTLSDILQTIQYYQPKSGLAFCENPAHFADLPANIVAVPTMSVLLTEPSAKKSAWRNMQRLL